MPALHSLCFAPTPSLPNSAKTIQWAANLSTKPSSLSFNNFNSSSSSGKGLELPLPLPDLPDHVKEKILCMEIMGIDSGRAIAINPAIREVPIESIHSIVSFLQSKGIHYKDLGRILGMCPKILTSDVGNDLNPVFCFISNDLGVRESNFRRIINKCPRLLISSVRDQLKPALFYLQRLGFKDKESLAYNDTVLLVSSVERTLIPKLEFLTEMGFSREEAVGMVLRCPGLFTFSIENNFKPKFAYFVGEMGGKLEELKEFPQYFAFSLEKRIKPRHRELVDKNVNVPLSLMLKSTDDEFKQLLIHRKV